MAHCPNKSVSRHPFFQHSPGCEAANLFRIDSWRITYLTLRKFINCRVGYAHQTSLIPSVKGGHSPPFYINHVGFNHRWTPVTTPQFPSILLGIAENEYFRHYLCNYEVNSPSYEAASPKFFSRLGAGDFSASAIAGTWMRFCDFQPTAPFSFALSPLSFQLTSLSYQLSAEGSAPQLTLPPVSLNLFGIRRQIAVC